MALLESGRTGRILYGRVKPNEDIVQSVEKICIAHSICSAFVRGSLGSLSQASLEVGGKGVIDVAGPAVEILTMVGEVRSSGPGCPEATLSVTVAGPDGTVFGGRLVSGRNPVCITFELALEEWIPTENSAAEDALTKSTREMAG